MKHSFSEKLDVVRAIISGKSHNAICQARGLDRHLVRWCLTRYQAYGEEGLLNPSQGGGYSPSEKEAIILEHIKDGVPLRALCLRYDVNRSSIQSWLRKVLSGDSLYDVKHTQRSNYVKNKAQG